MEKIAKATGKDIPQTKRILEINLEHPVVKKMNDIFKTDKENNLLNDYIDLVYDLALIAEGGKIKNPTKFSKLVGTLMNQAMEK